jgi:hypothetical protein
LATLNGETISIAKNGLFYVKGIELIATPGSSQTIVFATSVIDTKIPANSEYLEKLGAKDTSLRFKIYLRKCASGEAFKNSGECKMCEPGIEYLIDPPEKEESCKQCPVFEAVCYGGNRIYPKHGFWRNSKTTDDFEE